MPPHYLDLNMVRAGVVRHPADWPWCSFAEWRSVRTRHQIFDRVALLRLLGGVGWPDLLQHQEHCIQQQLEQRRLERCPLWTESVAVGSEPFVRSVAQEVSGRQRWQIQPSADSDPSQSWFLRERAIPYKTRLENEL